MRQLVNPRLFGRPIIKFALFGCKNRPFYRLCVYPDKALGRHYEGNIIEQLGTFDPLPNNHNEKLVSLNIHRIKYWLGDPRIQVAEAVLEVLGLAGLLPLHPKTFVRAAESREFAVRDKELREAAKAKKQQQQQQPQLDGEGEATATQSQA